jgi:murein DD-endopeptidase MepM/ murein hydrolase activator NlpD
VQAIAAGRVIFSGRSGGAGNLIKIRHAGGFESQYMHLSRRFVRAGQHVDQGQRIGTVGATGLATGPHLDFRLRQNGRYVNFERLRPPRMTRINAERMQSFTADRDRHVALMEAGTQSAATESDRNYWQ